MRRRTSERGSVLMAVLLVITIGALVAASLASLSSAHVSAASGAMQRARLRAFAWSGVQGAMAELAAQREALLDGAEPELTAEWTFSDPESGREAVVRLLAWDGSEGSKLAESEPGKLDLNAAPVESIAKLPGVGAELAAAIVAARPLGSVEDLLAIDGVTRELWRGVREGDGEAAATPALARLVTVHAFDPNVQHGVEEDDEHAGRLRINLNTPWSERLGRDLDERFGEGTGDGVKELMENGESFKRPTDIVRVARSLGAGADDLVPVLDALACHPDQYVPGLVDLAHAPAEVLACVPGIDAALAEAIVSTRENGARDRRWSPLWPVLEKLVEFDAYAPALDHVSTRSLQWRLRVECGYAREQNEVGQPALQPRIEIEAVIDVASERPRIAWLRETTMDEVAWQLNATAPPSEDEPALEPGVESSDDPALDEPPGVFDEPQPPEDDADTARDPGDPSVDDPAEAGGRERAGGSDEPRRPRDNRSGRWTPGGGT